jgi:LPXTG-motif cell wall-anchored protein
MEPSTGRRRPRTGPPGPAEEPAAGGRESPGPRAGNRFTPLIAIGAAVVLAVVAIAFATGTADDLPWGAIIGVLVLIAFAWIAGRRRRIPPETDGDEP